MGDRPPRLKTWGGIPQTKASSDIRRTQSAPVTTEEDPTADLRSQLADTEHVDLPSSTLNEKLSMDPGEWEYLLDTLLGDRMLPRHVVPSYVTFNDVQKTKEQFARANGNHPGRLTAMQAHLSGQPDPTQAPKLQQLWKEFCLKETRLTKESAAHLVRPSGDFDQQVKLQVLLHYPTFSTLTPKDGEICDLTNPCIRMLVKKGLNPYLVPGFVLNDTHHRRENTSLRTNTSQPYERHNATVRKAHSDFTGFLIRKANARVILVMGQAARDTYCAQFKQGTITSIFMDVGPLQTVEVLLDHDRGLVHRVLVACPHPEAVFRARTNRKLAGIGTRMDNAIQVAVNLADIPIQLNGEYFRYMEGSMGQSLKTGVPMDGVQSLIHLLWRENEHAPKWEFSDLPKAVLDKYESYFKKAPTKQNMEDDLLPLCPSFHVSLVKGLHVVMIQRSVEWHRAAGFPNRVKATQASVETQRAAGFPNLAKGRGYPYGVNRAGFQGSSKGGLASVEKARKAGFPNLAGGNQARREKKVQEVHQASTDPDQSKYFYCLWCVWVNKVWKSFGEHVRSSHPGTHIKKNQADFTWQKSYAKRLWEAQAESERTTN